MSTNLPNAKYDLVFYDSLRLGGVEKIKIYTKNNL